MQDSQKVAIFGASGLVGRAVTEALLTRGNYVVNGLMRNPEKLELKNAQLNLLKGDVFDQQMVEQALEGCVALVVTIQGHEDEFFTKAAKVISEACQKIGVKRVIYVAGAGILDYGFDYLFQNPNFPSQYVDGAIDHMAAFQIYKQASLDVTAICPPNIKEQEFTGNYSVQADTVVANNQWIVGNGEVADLILKEIQNPLYIGKRVSITNNID